MGLAFLPGARLSNPVKDFCHQRSQPWRGGKVYPKQQTEIPASISFLMSRTSLFISEISP